MVTGREHGARTMGLLPPLLLLVIPGCFCINGPLSVRGSKGDSLTIQCHYDPGWETYKKWWCRGEAWGSCEILIETTGSEQKVQRGRVSIQDDHWRNLITVTIEELWDSDRDTYWCGIGKSGTDLGHQVHVFVGPATLTVSTSPQTAKPVTTHPAAPETSLTPASLAPSPPVALSNHSNLSLTGFPTRSLACNIHLVLPTFVKVLLLMGLLCTVMWLQEPRGPQGGIKPIEAEEPQLPCQGNPYVKQAEPADLFSGNGQWVPFQKRQGSLLQ
ncbi:CMRF35-like molecule 5 isoform X2 [Pteronotus mesoamericanus]|uniref:CMRF35-like molecule 5 isoform X2 n=1 Tax=Pteronotus mesoamericanus TaxID=1884717 RepID=UPI0023EE276F|nr:CMRF35-like molecule 5 isoform X2 [Pteronotus parnellii mesoamericanus]